MLWHDPSEEPTYSQVVELDLSTVEPSLAGPRRPQDRVPAHAREDGVPRLARHVRRRVDPMKNGSTTRRVADTFPASDPTTEQAPGGVARARARRDCRSRSSAPAARACRSQGTDFELEHGSVVIAAITSCTNTSNPQVMVGAGLLAKKAVERGLQRKPWVKSSLAPGSKVVTEYYDQRRADARTSSSSASTPSATAARPASATPGRCPRRSRTRSRRATSSSAPCSPATATSRRASIRR